MAISITNRTRQLLIMPLNNGESLYLAPDRASDPIDETQVTGNEKFAKLLRSNLITSAEIDQAKLKKGKTDKESEK